MRTQQILFVDDDRFILEGLRRVTFFGCDQWDADFASSGQEALEMFEDEPYDIIVSDMRMPGMDGNELLKQIRDRYPKTIRLILSGQSENEDVLRAFGPAHHFIDKPCNVDKLKLTVERIVEIRQILGHSRLDHTMQQIPNLDTLVDQFKQFYFTIESRELSAEDVGQIVMESDELSAAVVRFVNSPAFNLSQPANDPYHALCLLSADQVRPLALASYVYNAIRELFDSCPMADAITKHCMGVAGRARMIASMDAENSTTVEYAFAAALLHDLGKLVLLGVDRQRYCDVLRTVKEDSISLIDAEMDEFNVTHAEVGAKLLSLCELPAFVVEAVLYHHCLRMEGEPEFNAAVAVHVANALENTELASELGGSNVMNREYLNRLGRLEKIESWRRSPVGANAS